MSYVSNHRGSTLVENLFGLLFITVASTLFVVIITNFIYQKELQKDDLIMLNISTKYIEEYYSILSNDGGLETPYRGEIKENHGDLEYTVSVKVDEKTQESNSHWVAGKVYQIGVETTNGLKSKVVTTYVFKE